MATGHQALLISTGDQPPFEYQGYSGTAEPRAWSTPNLWNLRTMAAARVRVECPIFWNF